MGCAPVSEGDHPKHSHKQIFRKKINMNMSLRAYAKHRGVSPSAVVKAVSTGRIQKEADGSINAAKADAQWGQHTRQAQAPAPAPPASRRPVAAAVSQVLGAPSGAADEARSVDYHKARAVRETYAARLAKLEFEERTGKLISKDEVDIKYFQLARQLRDRMQQIPRKVAPEIVALVVADPDVRGVTDILEVAIREALEDLAR